MVHPGHALRPLYRETLKKLMTNYANERESFVLRDDSAALRTRLVFGTTSGSRKVLIFTGAVGVLHVQLKDSLTFA